ncbi:hypothetical protein ONR49_25070, partial [Salmonella enterica subsp. enterica serovar Virginia]|nr:hypothetical protein [Salmonella enterica subsp. enterica serovar Virginia]
ATVKNTADHTSEATKLSAGAASVVKNNGEMMNQVTQKMRVINGGIKFDLINVGGGIPVPYKYDDENGDPLKDNMYAGITAQDFAD